MRRLSVFLIVIAVLAGALLWWRARAPRLTLEQKELVDRFLRKYLADQEITEADIAPIVAIGDPAVPRLIKAIGNVTPSQPLICKCSDANMVDCLARIATPEAAEGICKILKHEYPGYYGMDRMQAAAALVRLGARDKAPVLRDVVVTHRKLVARQRYPEMYHDEVVVLENALKMLEAGEGVQDTINFGRGGILEYGFLRTVKSPVEEAVEEMVKALEGVIAEEE